MKFRTLFVTLLSAIGLTVQAQEVLLVGNCDAAVEQVLREADYTVSRGDAAELDAAKLVVVDARRPVTPDLRLALANHLRRQGSVMLLGTEAFNYAPEPYDIRPIVDLTDTESYVVERDKRNLKAGSLETPKPVLTETPEGVPAVELQTRRRSMPDMFLKIDLPRRLDDDYTVLTFQACGNAYVDLLALEIYDRKGARWLAFCPLTNQWDSYAVSLADFIPEGSHEEHYEPLQPSQIHRLFMGVNLYTIWYEQPSYLALADIGFARNRNSIYAPTSDLMRLHIPFERMNTKVPDAIFDPAYGATRHNDRTIINNSIAWVTGVRMGDDTGQGYKTKDTRESRLYPLVEQEGVGNEAQIEFFANGPLAGGAVALFANEMPPKQLAEKVVQAADLMTRTPMVIAADMHTSRPDEQENVYPHLQLTLRNPLGKIVKADLSVEIANRIEYDDTDLTLKEDELTIRKFKLRAVRQGFPTTRFDWRVRLVTNHSIDEWRDRVDLERALLIAFRHLVHNQRLFPDGRISNHYFGDAYGVRAMLAFLYYAEKDAALVERHRDIFATVSFEDMRLCAYRFFDMLCRRQAPNGSMPMGYGEHGRICNVADMGQISLAMAQSSQYVADPERRERYLTAARRLAHWAETYYIDAERSQRLKSENPKAAARGWADEGEYGLGASGDKQRLTGPRWVLADILGIQTYLAFYDTSEERAWARPIYERNARHYLKNEVSSEGYFQAEAMFWLRKSIGDAKLIAQIDDNLTRTMLGKRYRTTDREPYKLGGRGSLNALPLLYYQRYIDDNANLRAVLLKYLWAFAAQGSLRNMERQSGIFPKSTHGEGLAASKFASFSALWAVEMLYPESTFTPLE